MALKFTDLCVDLSELLSGCCFARQRWAQSSIPCEHVETVGAPLKQGPSQGDNNDI